MKTNIKCVLDYLNKYKIRATYTAVQSYLGYRVQDRLNWAEVLGPRCPYASWIVRKDSKMPIGYKVAELHPELESQSKIITKGRELRAALDGVDEMEVEVADCYGNNCAVICKVCEKAYCVSGFLTKGMRTCPHCGKSKASFKEVKAEWEATRQEPEINPEQESNRLIFKKEWLGYDVWVTFSENGMTYRYPHDQLLQTFFNRLGIIENTESWKKGIYHFPRLSAEQKKLLQRYVVDAQ